MTRPNGVALRTQGSPLALSPPELDVHARFIHARNPSIASTAT